MHGTPLAMLVGAGLLGLALTACASREETSAADAAGTSTTAGATAGQTTGGPGTTTPMGAQATEVPGQLTEADIQKYVQARRFLEAQDVSLREALQSGDVSNRESRISELLRGQHRAWPTPQQFVQIHRQIQADPGLRARVEQELQAAGTTGAQPASGAAPTGASGAAPSGSPAQAPQTSASPQ
jgi:hypothetical protein